ncbi:MAG: hypothetical protein HYU39_05300 [Thaumarchaeota archaeon]|nr:hypothetical protein [Nitrososphaerota archaeon]
MADPLTDAALAWLHIFAVVGWMGTGMFIVMVMGPLMPSLSPQTRGELIIRLFPRIMRYIAVFATLTGVVGIILAFSKTGGNLSLLSPNNIWGLRVTVGASLAVIAYVIAMTIVMPTTRKIVGLVQQMQQNPQQGPSPQIPVLQKRMRIASTTALALMALSLIFMVAASRLPPV